MAVDAQDPFDVVVNLGGDLLERIRKLGKLFLAVFADLGRSGIEQHFRLEDEPVADDLDVRTVAEDLAQPPEEFGAVSRQLLDLHGERGVEPLDRKSTSMNSSH